jgi:hypothetical protein
MLLKDEAITCRVMGRRHPLSEGRPTTDLFTASLGCFRGDSLVVCRCSESTRPTAGQPRLPLSVHGVVD